MEEDTGEIVYRFEVTGELDRQIAEALRLEIRRLAKQFGVEVSAFRLEAPTKGPSS
jgi:hypothetical protein